MSTPHTSLVRALCISFLLLIGITLAQAGEALTYDANGNIETRTLPSGTTTYQYDDLDRVKNEAGPAKTQAFTWDANGNRTNDASGTHTYTPNSNRQATIAGQSVMLDEAGNIIQARNLGFVWNAQGQLVEVHQGSPSGPLLATYSYDYQNRRMSKVTEGNGNLLLVRTTIYAYDQYDRLIGEFNGAGSPKRTYLWRDNVPLAVIDHGPTEVVTYIETDHLGTPIAVKDKDGTVVWRWESEAFGATAPNQDADGDGSPFVLNLRFPGQYFDAESGLHYNHHRYYDPKIGRYISSDPIGLAGGINTYAYVGGNPLSYRDPLGLDSDSITPICPECFFIPLARNVTKLIEACTSKPADTTPATTPTGRRGSPMDVPPGTNSPARVNGRDYSGHALDQMQGRGVTPSTVENTITKGTVSPGNTAGTTAYNDAVNGVTVVTNSQGRVVTVITTGRGVP